MIMEKKGVKLTKKFNEPNEIIEILKDEDTKQYFPKDNYNVGSYIESKIEENNEGVLMYTKVTHYVKPYETQSVSTSNLNNIFDEEINLSERKEYDNVSSLTFVIEDIISLESLLRRCQNKQIIDSGKGKK